MNKWIIIIIINYYYYYYIIIIDLIKIYLFMNCVINYLLIFLAKYPLPYCKLSFVVSFFCNTNKQHHK